MGRETELIEIRSAVPADAEALSEIAHAAKASWGYPPEWIQIWDDELTVSSDYIERANVYVAIEAGLILGFGALEQRGSDWNLGHLWVGPAAQRKGIGARLMQHVLSEAARIAPGGSMRVDADPNTIGFYSKLGGELIEWMPVPMPGAPERKIPIFEFQL